MTGCHSTGASHASLNLSAFRAKADSFGSRTTVVASFDFAQDEEGLGPPRSWWMPHQVILILRGVEGRWTLVRRRRPDRLSPPWRRFTPSGSARPVGDLTTTARPGPIAAGRRPRPWRGA